MSELRLEPSFSSSGARSHGLDLLWVYRFPIVVRLSSTMRRLAGVVPGPRARLVVSLCPIGLKVLDLCCGRPPYWAALRCDRAQLRQNRPLLRHQPGLAGAQCPLGATAPCRSAGGEHQTMRGWGPARGWRCRTGVLAVSGAGSGSSLRHSLKGWDFPMLERRRDLCSEPACYR